MYNHSAKKNFLNLNMNIVEINHDINSESFHVIQSVWVPVHNNIIQGIRVYNIFYGAYLTGFQLDFVL